MIHTTIFLLFGRFGIYYTFCTLISLTSNTLLLIFFTLIAILIQITFIDLILPNSLQNTIFYFTILVSPMEQFLLKLIYNLIQKFHASNPIPNIPTT